MMTETTGTTEEVIPVAEGPDWAAAYIRDFDAEKYLPDALQPVWDFSLDYPFLLPMVMVVTGYLLGKLLQLLLQSVLGRLANKTETSLDDHLLKLLSAPVLQTTVILSMVLALKVLGFSDQMQDILARLLLTLLIFFWARAWFRAVKLALPALSAETGRFKLLQPRTLPLFDMGIKLALLTIFMWFFMVLWNINGTAWLASAGVVGIAVGFAAKDTLANLIAGVSIIADAPYKINDYIVLDSGERGVVTGLGMRSTRLITRDDVEISIPNAVMGNAKISNESGGPQVQHRIRVSVGVAYGTDTALVMTLLERVAHECPLIIEEPAPRVRMRAFGDSSLDFDLLGWISHPEFRGLATHELLMAINESFRQEGIVIPFPQRDLHINAERESGEPKPANGDSEVR